MPPEEQIDARIAENVTALRTAAGLSQEALAARLQGLGRDALVAHGPVPGARVVS